MSAFKHLPRDISALLDALECAHPPLLSAMGKVAPSPSEVSIVAAAMPIIAPEPYPACIDVETIIVGSPELFGVWL